MITIGNFDTDYIYRCPIDKYIKAFDFEILTNVNSQNQISYKKLIPYLVEGIWIQHGIYQERIQGIYAYRNENRFQVNSTWFYRDLIYSQYLYFQSSVKYSFQLKVELVDSIPLVLIG